MYHRGQFNISDVDVLGTFAAGSNSIPVDLRKLAALGKERKGGMVPKLAALEVVAGYTLTTTMAAQDGIVPGKRVHEIISRVQLSPDGWVKRYSHDLSAKALRRFCNYEHGRAVCLDSADIADADATVTGTISTYVPYWREGSFEPRDFCPELRSVGEGSMQLSVNTPPIDGWTAVSMTSARVIAHWFWGDPGVPVFTVLQERITPSSTRFRLDLAGDRLRRAYLMGDGSQTALAGATTHLAASFEESVTVQFNIGGERVIEDARIDDLCRTLLNNANYDAAIDESLTVPEVIPLVTAGRGLKTTKARGNIGDAWFESSAAVQDTATTNTRLAVITDETFGARPGTAATEAYRRTVSARGGALVRATSSKVRGVSHEKSDAVPLRELSGKE